MTIPLTEPIQPSKDQRILAMEPGLNMYYVSQKKNGLEITGGRLRSMLAGSPALSFLSPVMQMGGPQVPLLPWLSIGGNGVQQQCAVKFQSSVIYQL